LKNFILVFLFLFLSNALFAQSWLWAKESTPQSISGIGDLPTDHSIAVDNSGNVYMVGVFSDTIGFGAYQLKTSARQGNVFLTKYSPSGAIIWVRQAILHINTQGGCWGTGVAVDTNKNVFITGVFSDTVTFGTYTLIDNQAQEETFITKYDSAGNVLWARQSSLQGSGTANSIAVDNFGNAYITGQFRDSVFFGTKALHCSFVAMFLVKYDQAGSVLWAKQPLFDNISTSCGNSVAADVSGNAYITGYFSNSIKLGAFTLTGSAYSNVFAAKYDSSGNVIWAKQASFSSHPGVNACSITVDAFENVYLTGQFTSNISFGTYNLTTGSNSNSDFFLVKYGKMGNVAWAKQGNVLDNNSWSGISIAYTKDLNQGQGYLAVVGYNTYSYNIGIGNDTFLLNLNYPYRSATILVNFDSAGNTSCGSIFSEGTEDDADGICVDKYGEYVYLGGDIFNSLTLGKDSLPYGNDMPFIARWQPCSSSVLPPPVTAEPCNSLFVPDAFSPNNDGQNDILYVRGDCINTMDFLIFDRWGNKVFESENQSIGWDGSYKGQAMNTGTYVWYLKVTLNDGTVVNKKGSVALVR